MNKNRKRNLFIILGVCIFTVALGGGTYAYFQKILFSDLKADTITHGLDYYINYAKGTDITNGVLNPSTDYTGGNNVTVTFNKKDNTYDIYGHIYLDVTTIGNNLKNSTALKYEVYKNSTRLASGTLNGVSGGNSILLTKNIPLATTTQTYTVYLWLDENAIDNYDIENETISANIRCEATMKTIS